MRAIASTLFGPRRGWGAAALALSVAMLLSACAPDPAPSHDAAGVAAPGTGEQAARPDADGATPEPATPVSLGETVGGDGSAIHLDALTGDDLSGADVAGELACNFAVDDDAPLLFAMGVVASGEPAQGVVKVSGHVEPIRAPGGFDGMLRGATFTGQGKTIVVDVTGAAIGGGESPPVPATLTYQRADGATRTFEGRWQCGP